MRLGELLWMLVAIFIVVAVCGALTLLIWWLWRKITLPEGAPPPKWTDLSGLKSGMGKAPIVIRLAVVGVLGLLMSAPIGLIHDLIKERAASYSSVVRELSYSWGGQQLLIGPILSIPYTIRYSVTEEQPLTEAEKLELAKLGDLRTTKIIRREIVKEKTAVLLPEDLIINGTLKPQERRRGIYSVRVYTADLALSGSFKRPDFKTLDSRVSEVHWNKAAILVNLSDTKAFRGISPLSLSGRKYKFVPGTKNSPIAPTGFSADVDLTGGGDIAFGFDMTIGGSQGFYVSPIAVASNINLKSPWPHPKYGGTGLPTRHETTDRGFDAVWEVPNLVRNYPQFADIDDFKRERQQKESYSYDEDSHARPAIQTSLMLAEYIIGLDFFEPVFHYSILLRAVKYAMMFIALTFLSVLIFEIATGRKNRARLHLAQYGIIGLGLCLFYLILLAVSEHMPFLPAYLLAATVNVAMIGGYVRAALKRNKEALVVSGILAALYSALYFILKMEEYSLVSGTVLLVLAMIALMHATRNLSRPDEA
ncbi:hypothetical protein C4J81_11165 [Deltaproteobacteria bacterium Smac51]|nr:hypothetical protein C4J81_11165 [Deltaproteobacteria bacterium Smac51]